MGDKNTARDGHYYCMVVSWRLLFSHPTDVAIEKPRDHFPFIVSEGRTFIAINDLEVEKTGLKRFLAGCQFFALITIYCLRHA